MVGELTDRFELNHNAIRQHLAKLVAAGLLLEERAAPSGPGRPRLLYSVDPAAESRWGVTGPYERLSMLLAEIIRSGATPVEIGRRAGRRDAAAHLEDGPSAALLSSVARGGFEPTLQQRGDDVEVLLHACPFTNVALADPDIVCESGAMRHAVDYLVDRAVDRSASNYDAVLIARRLLHRVLDDPFTDPQLHAYIEERAASMGELAPSHEPATASERQANVPRHEQ